MPDLSKIRTDYHNEPMKDDTLPAGPYSLFNQWYEQAATVVTEPNAMTLATVDQSGQPHARMVLLKGYDTDGFRFFTNYQSPKAQEIADNPKASLLFWWQSIVWQVRIEGTINKLSASDSDDYFAQRPIESNIASSISQQSQVIDSRQTLIDGYDEKKFTTQPGQSIKRPDFWGGYILKAQRFEFWQGVKHRLHDRFLYLYDDDKGLWTKQRLAP